MMSARRFDLAFHVLIAAIAVLTLDRQACCEEKPPADDNRKELDLADPEKFVNRYFLRAGKNPSGHHDGKSMGDESLLLVKGKDATISLETSAINFIVSQRTHLGGDNADYLVSIIVFSTPRSLEKAIEGAKSICRQAGLADSVFTDPDPGKRIADGPGGVAKQGSIQVSYPHGVAEKEVTVEIRAVPLSDSQYRCVLNYYYIRPRIK